MSVTILFAPITVSLFSLRLRKFIEIVDSTLSVDSTKTTSHQHGFTSRKNENLARFSVHLHHEVMMTYSVASIPIFLHAFMAHRFQFMSKFILMLPIFYWLD